MRKFKILLIVVFLTGCSKMSNDNILVFKDSISFQHIDFKNIDAVVINDNFNSLVATVQKEDDAFFLHLVDVNRNGKFNDGEDAIMINPFTSLAPQNITFNNKIKSENYFAINNKVFKISKINKINSEYNVYFEWDALKSNKDINLENRMINKLPDLAYESFNKKKIKLSSFLNKEKYVYIEFWALWCSPCISFIPEIKDLNKNYSNKLEILSIVSDRQFDRKATESFINMQKMNWNQGISNERINNELSFNFLPRGYLFDKDGKLVLYNASPKTVKFFLDNLEKN